LIEPLHVKKFFCRLYHSSKRHKHRQQKGAVDIFLPVEQNGDIDVTLRALLPFGPRSENISCNHFRTATKVGIDYRYHFFESAHPGLGALCVLAVPHIGLRLSAAREARPKALRYLPAMTSSMSSGRRQYPFSDTAGRYGTIPS